MSGFSIKDVEKRLLLFRYVYKFPERGEARNYETDIVSYYIEKHVGRGGKKICFSKDIAKTYFVFPAEKKNVKRCPIVFFLCLVLIQ